MTEKEQDLKTIGDTESTLVNYLLGKYPISSSEFSEIMNLLNTHTKAVYNFGYDHAKDFFQPSIQ